PALRPARVRVTLTDGRVVTHAVDSHRGDFNQPFEEAEIRAKFHELAGEVLTPAGTGAIEAAVDSCETWTSVGDLVALLRLHGRE
ncbi:MAG TPA: MmgE/PrpD family protein, partial [Rhodopila sp.]